MKHCCSDPTAPKKMEVPLQTYVGATHQPMLPLPLRFGRKQSRRKATKVHLSILKLLNWSKLWLRNSAATLRLQGPFGLQGRLMCHLHPLTVALECFLGTVQELKFPDFETVVHSRFPIQPKAQGVSWNTTPSWWARPAIPVFSSKTHWLYDGPMSNLCSTCTS